MKRLRKIDFLRSQRQQKIENGETLEKSDKHLVLFFDESILSGMTSNENNLVIHQINEIFDKLLESKNLGISIVVGVQKKQLCDRLIDKNFDYQINMDSSNSCDKFSLTNENPLWFHPFYIPMGWFK